MVKIASEHSEQVQFVHWFRQTYPSTRIFAIPNGGARNIITAQRLKMEGVESGVPDLFIPAWKIWVEMKKEKGGSTSKKQKEWNEYLTSVGYKVFVCKGCVDAKKTIEAFINEK